MSNLYFNKILVLRHTEVNNFLKTALVKILAVSAHAAATRTSNFV